MTNIQSLLLGALQGVAEFLPISSSGHLVLLRQLLDLGEIPLLYDVLLHVSTLIVVVIVFRSKIGSILASMIFWVISSARSSAYSNIAFFKPANSCSLS